MITADKLKTLTSFTAQALTRAINLAGYKGDSFDSAEFVGITNAGQFCYLTTYEEMDEIHKAKVFVNYDPTGESVTVSY
jgi:hypothetical protein